MAIGCGLLIALTTSGHRPYSVNGGAEKVTCSMFSKEAMESSKKQTDSPPRTFPSLWSQKRKSHSAKRSRWRRATFGLLFCPMEKRCPSGPAEVAPSQALTVGGTEKPTLNEG